MPQIPDSNAGMPSVDPELGNNALSKISSGKALTELSPQEQAAVGKMGTYAIQAAIAKRTQPKTPQAASQPPAMAPGGQSKDYVPPSTTVTNPVAPVLPTGVNPRDPIALRNQQVAAIAGTRRPIEFPDGPQATSADQFVSTEYKRGNAPNSWKQEPGLPGTGVENPANWKDQPVAAAKTPDSVKGIGDKGKGKEDNGMVGPMPIIPKDVKGRDLADIIGNVLDVLGSGAGGYAGRASPTMLNRQKIAQIAGEQKQAEISAENEGKIQMMPLELQQALDLAKASGDYEAAKQIAIANGIQPLEIEKIEAARKYGLLGGGPGAMSAGINAVTGK